jgi:hypothetical protein
MVQPERFEALVLGSGQGGKVLAWHMAQLGLRTAARRTAVGHCRRSTRPKGVRNHARRDPETCALPKLVRCGVSSDARAESLRLASGWTEKWVLDHGFTLGASGARSARETPSNPHPGRRSSTDRNIDTWRMKSSGYWYCEP